jgi:alpha-tubulin suppressor-like RCC1 family protein
MSNNINKSSLIGSLVCGILILLASGPLLADRITAGDAHNLTARGDGSQYVWGSDSNGQLGDGLTLDALNPIPVVDIRYNALGGAIAVVAHGDDNLVLLDDATLLGWGPNGNSQLGSGLLYSGKYRGDVDDGTDPELADATSNALVFPTKVVDPEGKPIANITAIALGANFAAAVNQEGNLLVWGDLDAFREKEVDREPINRFRDNFFDPNIDFIDSRYRDGDPETDFDLQYMRDVQGNRYTNIISVAVGDKHLLALTNTGHVLAWGENSAGQLGDGTLIERSYPVFVRNIQNEIIGNITSIGARGLGSMAVKADGQLLGWGSSALIIPLDTTLPDPYSRSQESYARALADYEGNPITGLRRVAFGDSHALGLTLDSHIIGWGSNSHGQLGDGTNFTALGTSTVVLVDGQPIGDVIEIAVGSSHSLALRRNGYVFAWGLGDNGRLGDGTNIDSYYAVNIRDVYNNPFSLFY